MSDPLRFAQSLRLGTERTQFMNEFDQQSKSPAVATVLCVFLGGVGAHHFYLGRTTLGVIYALMCWSFIPVILSIIESFFIAGVVRDGNVEIAREIAEQIMLARKREAGVNLNAGPRLTGGW